MPYVIILDSYPRNTQKGAKMDLISRLKTRYQHKIEKKYIKTIKRKQFNLTMADDIILSVKLIAASLEVPMYVACEHILQVGSYQLLKSLKNPEKRQKLTEHLVKVHLLGDELKEDGAVLRLGQEN